MAATDYDPLLERAAGARFVLLGEASHGTHEFYRERAEITKRRLAGRLPRQPVRPWRERRRRRGRGALRLPSLPGVDVAHTDVVEFVSWLREWNDDRPDEAKVGFYGLDLYSLYTSMEAVVRYLEEVDPEAAERARERNSCFDHFKLDQTRAVEPLERTSDWVAGELPETYPFAV